MRWRNTDPIEASGIKVARTKAQLCAGGRIEFAFMPTDGERILPPSRYFPMSPTIDRWLRSTEIELGGG